MNAETRLADRLSATDAELPGLQASVTDCEAAWANAVTAGDAKAEKTAHAALETANVAHRAAQARRGLLADALAQAKRDALPGEAQELAELFRTRGAEAAALALSALEHHKQGENAAGTVHAIHAELQRAGQAFKQKCITLGVNRNSLPGAAVFPVDVNEFARLYSRSDPWAKKITADTILRNRPDNDVEAIA